MQNFSYFHESFNLRKLSSYFLNIELSKYGVCYVISDSIRNQHIVIKYLEFEDIEADVIENFQNVVKDDVYLNKHYKNVNFFLENNKYTLVPADLFDKKSKVEFLKYNHVIENNEEVHFSYIEKIEAYDIYAYPSVLINFLVNHFPEIRFFHTTTTFLNTYIRDNENSKDVYENVAINFNNNTLDILVIKNQKLLFLNDFDFNADEDAVFYIMNVLKKLKLNIAKISVTVQGKILVSDKLYQYLVKFLPQIKFKSKFKKEFPFNKVSPHLFANILSEL